MQEGWWADRSRISRTLKFLAGGAAVVLALAACSSTTGAEGATAPSSASAANVSGDITYAFWNRTQEPAVKAEVAAFEKKYPKVKVTVDLTPWDSYWTKLQTEGQSKTLPDVFWMNNDNFKLYASNGLLAKVPASISLGGYTKSVVDSYGYGGAKYGVPSFQAGVGVWYNKAILEKAGVPIPKAGWTWDDFQKDAKAVSDALGSQGIYGVADDLSDGAATYYPTILQAGGYVVSSDGKKSGFDTSQGIAGLEFWRTLIANGSSPSLQQLSDTADIDWFTSGKAAFFWGISSYADTMSASSIASDVNVAPLPVGKVAANMVSGNANVMSATSANPAAAEAFLNFLAGEQAQSLLSTATWPALSGPPQVEWEKRYPFDMNVFVDAQKISVQPYPSLATTAEWQQAEQALMPKLLSGGAPVDLVAKEIATQVDAILAK